MSGFPTRPSRAAFGPTPQNRGGVGDPAKEFGADTADLAFWQVAGCSGVVDGARALLTWTGAALVLTRARESWDPNGASAPEISRTSAGLYVVTYAANYPDKDGRSVATDLVAAKAFPQTTADVRAVAQVTSSRIVTVTVRNSAGAAVDASVLVEVWS